MPDGLELDTRAITRPSSLGCSNACATDSCADAGELDAFELDDLIHRYKRSVRELWKYCSVSGGHMVRVARMVEDVRAREELPDRWEAGRPRRDAG